jgi:hypothetical protein
MGNSSSKTKKAPEKVSSQKKLQKNQNRVSKPQKHGSGTWKIPWSNQYGNSVTGVRAKKDKK